MKNYRYLAQFLTIMAVLGWTIGALATDLFSFGDTEKPNPEFHRNGQEITAKLIPRAKSTSVMISFKVSDGGSLADVKGIDFATVDRPEVNVKNFKSAAFEIHITGVKPGGTAALSIQSDFFTSSTAFYVYNPNQEQPWMDIQAENLPLTGRVRELTIAARDGDKLDADGLADGRITVIGGPRDSFWGYALGTLLIRFFGIFIVLSILMIGMIASGFIFSTLERHKTKPGKEQKDPVKPVMENKEKALSMNNDTAGSVPVPEEAAAAICAALHLHLSSMRGSGRPGRETGSRETVPPDNAWALEGRKTIMNDRLSVFNRLIR